MKYLMVFSVALLVACGGDVTGIGSCDGSLFPFLVKNLQVTYGEQTAYARTSDGDIYSDLTCDNLDTVIFVKAIDSDLRSLNGAQFMTALEGLHVSGNSFTNITPLRNLVFLRSIDLSWNQELIDVGALVDNENIGWGDNIDLRGTSVPCVDVERLETKGAAVRSDC